MGERLRLSFFFFKREIIASLGRADQPKFLEYLKSNNIERNEAEARVAKRRFLNNTIYTIGYEGKELGVPHEWQNPYNLDSRSLITR
jgi:hypothetical protein